MLRGRRVVFFVVLFLYLYFCAIYVNALEMGVSATVTLSTLWQQAIQKNSIVTLDRTHQNIVVCNIKTRGVEEMIVPGEHIQALLFKNNVLSDSSVKVTNKNGDASHVFVYTKGEKYRIMLINVGHEFPFIIRSLSFEG